jgi:hypothetical protein
MEQYPCICQINIIFQHTEEAGNFRIKIFLSIHKKLSIMTRPAAS